MTGWELLPDVRNQKACIHCSDTRSMESLWAFNLVADAAMHGFGDRVDIRVVLCYNFAWRKCSFGENVKLWKN